MQVMMLAAGQGSELHLKTEGSDEKEALDAMMELFNNRFDEQD
jgi:phosphocarrier protein